MEFSNMTNKVNLIQLHICGRLFLFIFLECFSFFFRKCFVLSAIRICNLTTLNGGVSKKQNKKNNGEAIWRGGRGKMVQM